jgi:hypothetical protein
MILLCSYYAPTMLLLCSYYAPTMLLDTIIIKYDHAVHTLILFILIILRSVGPSVASS